MKKLIAALLALILLLGCTALAEEAVSTENAPLLVDRINTPDAYPDFAFAENAPLLEIIFPQILDSDVALIRCGGENILIDCGSNRMAGRAVTMLEQLGITRIDRVINTHPHYDHIQGIGVLAEAVEIGELAVCFEGRITEHLPVALAVCEEKGIPVTLYEDGTHWDVGGTAIDAWLKGDEDWSLNERSAQLRLQFGDRTALFTADALNGLQKRLTEVIPPELLDVDVLKYPHHGKEALLEAFMDATTPAFAVLTNNGGQGKSRYCLGLRGIPYAFTVPGYVSLTTDGTTWLAERIPMDNPIMVTSRPDTRKDQ